MTLRMLRAIRLPRNSVFRLRKNIQCDQTGCRQNRIISQERVTEEINKIIAAPKPSSDLICSSDRLLQIIFPKMAELAGAEYIDGLGHKDNFTIPAGA
jgi:tRNA nucleotidyltransferase/poly(A) polymerase